MILPANAHASLALSTAIFLATAVPSRAAERYAALGRPADVAQRIADFRSAGVRHVVLDPVCPFAERAAQLERFAREVRPLL